VDEGEDDEDDATVAAAEMFGLDELVFVMMVLVLKLMLALSAFEVSNS
jgi:hypothetical protein